MNRYVSLFFDVPRLLERFMMFDKLAATRVGTPHLSMSLQMKRKRATSMTDWTLALVALSTSQGWKLFNFFFSLKWPWVKSPLSWWTPKTFSKMDQLGVATIPQANWHPLCFERSFISAALWPLRWMPSRKGHFLDPKRLQKTALYSHSSARLQMAGKC